MKFTSLIKMIVAVICLIAVICFATACGNKKNEETEAPGTDTPSVEDNVPDEDVDDDAAASDIGDEVVLPPVEF